MPVATPGRVAGQVYGSLKNADPSHPGRRFGTPSVWRASARTRSRKDRSRRTHRETTTMVWSRRSRCGFDRVVAAGGIGRPRIACSCWARMVQVNSVLACTNAASTTTHNLSSRPGHRHPCDGPSGGHPVRAQTRLTRLCWIWRAARRSRKSKPPPSAPRWRPGPGGRYRMAGQSAGLVDRSVPPRRSSGMFEHSVRILTTNGRGDTVIAVVTGGSRGSCRGRPDSLPPRARRSHCVSGAVGKRRSRWFLPLE